MLGELLGALSNLNQNLIGINFRPISIKELVLIPMAFGDIYRFDGGLFQITIRKDTEIKKDLLKNLLERGYEVLFLESIDYNSVKDFIQDKLIKTTRSLSIGNPLANGNRQVSLLSLNLQSLYAEPLKDETLEIQFNGTKNLGIFLLENKVINPSLYQNLKKLNHHFVITQPLLSSLLTIGFLQYLKTFKDKELENLFLTSMLKDIGMSFIPNDKYDKRLLSTDEKQLFKDHTLSSKKILEDRVPLNKNCLDIIENHHFLNDQITLIRAGQKVCLDSNPEIITGLETLIISVMDIIVAMTEERPYVKKSNLFNALELCKKLMEDDYPHEFRALVVYLKKFFT
ncbi:MAG: hypothetical protein ACI9QD_001162 [Thermoproteota archaeon]|jgi:hypothetical protein